jgi:dTDP-4-dehydrorhamnose reductase
MKNILILGATGYIGSAFLSQLTKEGHNVKALSRSKDFDYTNISKFKEFIDINWHAGDFDTKNCIVINCAGYVGKPNVDQCEIEKDETILGNVVFPAQISEVLYARGIPLCHISSGCIYSGYTKPFSEEDPPNFNFSSTKYTCSFYSGTKALAEQVIQRNPLAYIFRLRIPFDEYSSPRNYITKLLTYDRLIDMANSFSHRNDFVKNCLELISVGAPYGIYNVTNNGSMTTREVVELIKYHLRDSYVPVIPYKEFEFFENYDSFSEEITAGRSNCILSTDKIEKYIDNRTVESAFEEALSMYSF